MATLYRKYRPQVFDEVYGQKHIVETLKRALLTDRVAHAYLFCGARGVGKTTVARILAKAVNCTNENDRPCGKCENCKSIKAGKFIDLIEIDAASNRGIDEIRELRDKIQFAPSVGKKRVYIIDEVHMLTREAFNALLKTLEEPPAHTIFIFATTEAHKVPITVMSRCQRFDFLLADEDQVRDSIKQIVKSEGFKIEEKVIDLIVRASGGSFRDSQSLLDQLSPYLDGGEISITQALQILNLTSFEKVSEFAKLLKSDSPDVGFQFVKELTSHGVDFNDFLKMVIIEIRAELIEKIKRNQPAQWETDALKRLIKAQEDLKISPVESLALELAIADICSNGTVQQPAISDQKREKMIEDDHKKSEEVIKPVTPKVEPKKEEPKESEIATAKSDKVIKDKIEFSDDQRRAIVEEVSIKNKTLGSLLTTASWQMDQDGLKIIVEYSFYKDKIMDKRNFSQIQKVAENILGDTVSIQCEVRKNSDNSIGREIDEVFG